MSCKWVELEKQHYSEEANGKIQAPARMGCCRVRQSRDYKIFFKIEYLPVGDGETARITDTDFGVAIDLQKNPTKNSIYLWYI
jgi:hypothetical protein